MSRTPNYNSATGVPPVGETMPMGGQDATASLPLPAGLAHLINTGVWPVGLNVMNRQQLHPLVPEFRVRRFAPEESVVCLASPPFHTVADEMTPESVLSFWQPLGAVDQIVPSLALVIGDFGLGSDAPIILNYAIDRLKPPAYRLRWGPDRVNRWVRGAESFEELADLFGLA